MLDTTTKPKKRRARNYVNNPDFYASLVAYFDLCKAEPEKNHKVPRYIGECITQIATRFAVKPSFSAYSYKDEMIEDAIENCFRYLDKFNPEKGNNPFAYFTQVVKNAFIRRIKEEKMQQAIKMKCMYRTLFDSSAYNQGSSNIDKSVLEFIEETDRKLLTKKKNSGKVKKSSKIKIEDETIGIEQFMKE